MSDRIPVILCIDIEPDPQRPDPANPQPWRGFERLFRYLQQLRHRMEDTTGKAVRLNWFWRMDPQVEMVHKSSEWGPRRYQTEIEEMTLAGDEHGLHPHAWRWDMSLGRWISDYRNLAWLEQCITTSLMAFESVFGRACETVRLGNGYFDDRVRETLERLGCLFDLTVEPGERPGQASIQDYRSMEMGPYRPSVEDFRRPDPIRSEGLWIIPLTAGVMSERGMKWRRFLRKRLSSVGKIPTGYGTLRLWEPPELVQPAIRKTLQNLERPYLAFAIRSDVLSNLWWGKNCRRNLEGLLTQEQGRRFWFSTPRDLLCEMDLPVDKMNIRVRKPENPTFSPVLREREA